MYIVLHCEIMFFVIICKQLYSSLTYFITKLLLSMNELIINEYESQYFENHSISRRKF